MRQNTPHPKELKMKAHKLFGKDKKQDDQTGLDTLSEEVNKFFFFFCTLNVLFFSQIILRNYILMMLFFIFSRVFMETIIKNSSSLVFVQSSSKPSSIRITVSDNVSETHTEASSIPPSSATSTKPSQSVSQDQIAPVTVETSTQQVITNVVQQQINTYNNNVNEKEHSADENVSFVFFSCQILYRF